MKLLNIRGGCPQVARIGSESRPRRQYSANKPMETARNYYVLHVVDDYKSKEQWPTGVFNANLFLDKQNGTFSRGYFNQALVELFLH
jgi:hypothetical protein